MAQPVTNLGPASLVDRPARLDEWLVRHGPLGPQSALVLVLGITARVSRLSRGELAAAIESLNPAGVTRNERGGWTWIPATTSDAARAIADDELIERLGALLFHCVAGQPLSDPFAGNQAIQARLRSLRPELPASIANLIVDALSARRGGLPLAAFALDLRHALGVSDRSEAGRLFRAPIMIVAAVVVAAAASAGWWWVRHGDDRIEGYGLTQSETVMLDVIQENAQAAALTDEHTAAIQEYQEIARLLATRLTPEDPRLTWIAAHEAWVRTLSGDRLTAEQALSGAPSGLGSALSDRHPYTRAVRLELADTLAARGAVVQASTLRRQAEQSALELLQGSGLTLGSLDQKPAPPGVLAHMAPNPPVQEGFRAGPGGEFLAPLSSTQRWMAVRAGWRLHVVASGACRASLIAGTIPRFVAVGATRAADGGWDVQIDGITPAARLHTAPAGKVGVSLEAAGEGVIEVRLGDGPGRSSHYDPSTRVPDPPYALTVNGGPQATGCAVVWLEIPFPSTPKTLSPSPAIQP